MNVVTVPYLRPPGFTVDAALPNAGAERYDGGGRERSGYVTPARLLIGETSFNNGKPTGFAPHLFTQVRVGDLFVCNKGPDPQFPGFLICPTCGRWLDPDDAGTHTYPADIPPHWGRQRGPRAGSLCPNTKDFRNQVLLGHRFHSEVMLLGVDLPDSMDAPFYDPSGKAVWYSFGTLVANAAALVLQIDANELSVGVRAVKRSPGRVHGEVFLYDNVPGGAGYARAINHDLQAIMAKALGLGQSCSNPDCPGACYHCMYDYRNQALHPLLDRRLGAAVLEYLLNGATPSIAPKEADRYATGLAEFARASWTILPPKDVVKLHFAQVLQDKTGQQVGVYVIHPLQARPTTDEKATILAQSGIRCAAQTSFDLERRPFWVLNHLVG